MQITPICNGNWIYISQVTNVFRMKNALYNVVKNNNNIIKDNPRRQTFICGFS